MPQVVALSSNRCGLQATLRDIGRKLADRPELAERFTRPLALIERLLAQRRHDKNKLYAVHAAHRRHSPARLRRPRLSGA
jgi:hypothetical protein